MGVEATAKRGKVSIRKRAAKSNRKLLKEQKTVKTQKFEKVNF